MLPADQVKPLVADLFAALEKSASDLATAHAENEQLRVKLAAAEESKVTLEKVASAPPAVPAKFQFSADTISKTVDAMVKAGFCRPEFSGRLASDLLADPSNALDVLERISEISTDTVPTGRAVKRASAMGGNAPAADGSTPAGDEEPEEDWRVMVRDGA